MSDFLSVYSSPDDSPAKESPPNNILKQIPQQKSNLFPCPDCGGHCSRQAEACPHCGRFIQRLNTTIKVDRHGWISTIAIGILLAAVLPWLLLIGIVIVLSVALGIGSR
jgi:predicted RNA-binding Zn-ribbon protein involved in translation (DUF1610 family)